MAPHLAQRTFKVSVGSEASSSSNHRTAQRIHISAQVLKASRVAAGETIVLKQAIDIANKLKISADSSKAGTSSGSAAEGPQFALGIAWPSFTLDANSAFALLIFPDDAFCRLSAASV
jgi:AAA family ATPase